MTVGTTTGTRPDVDVRAASPADVDFLAWCCLTATRSHLDRGIWEVFLGTDEQATMAFLRRLLLSEQEHWVHWTRFLVAEVDGRPEAGLCAFDPETHGFEHYLPVATQIAAQLMSPPEVEQAWARGEVVSSCLSEEAPGSWVVEAVATRPEARRQGLADQLLAQALDRGRDLGFRRAQISVYLGNDPARRCYVKNGFRPVGEQRSREFEALMGFPGIECLQRSL